MRLMGIHALCAFALLGSLTARGEAKIDRHALVQRHSPTITAVDPSSPFMVGNGEIAFTADITGLQTFQDSYSDHVPLMTQAQWAWHSFPNPNHYTIENALTPIDVRGSKQLYPWLRSWDEAKNPAIAWLRENPQRFSLGRIALNLKHANGAQVKLADLRQTHQTLDLWDGALRSSFQFDGIEVDIETRMHPVLDMLIVTLRSPLLRDKRLGIDLRFPGVAKSLNPDPADWSHPEAHLTETLSLSARRLSLKRTLDATRYFVDARADQNVTFKKLAAHEFRILPSASSDALTLFVLFSPTPTKASLPTVAESIAAVSNHWHTYWTEGGAIDFSGSKDPRAHELERRIVLSQYLMAVNAAGSLPPQEEGLFSNSWNGKFHLEMHPWHAAHFAVWGHTALLERSMHWYFDRLNDAKARAASHGVRGAWWPKMVGPEGRESPSTVNPFIMWQQPHPIYLAELIYRDRPTRETLQRYKELVFETADLLASFPHFDAERQRYVIGPPIIPVQEVFPPLTTFNPAFELEYFRFGLATAQQWRERLGLKRDAHWDDVIQRMSPLPQKDGLYLATESFPQLWEQARSSACSNGNTSEHCWNRDHPSFLAALGFLPGAYVDRDVMRKTLRAVEQHWDLRQLWGWDFPMIAMTATRLHEPEQAVEFLFSSEANNQYGLAGMVPRSHLEQPATHSTTGTSAAKDRYARDAETYFPANGSLLLAIALMTAGWDGNDTVLPGFPHDGSWKVRYEGLHRLP